MILVEDRENIPRQLCCRDGEVDRGQLLFDGGARLSWLDLLAVCLDFWGHLVENASWRSMQCVYNRLTTITQCMHAVSPGITRHRFIMNCQLNFALDGGTVIIVIIYYYNTIHMLLLSGALE